MPRCHAKNRQGEQCKKPAMVGKTVCRNHGGRSTGAKRLNVAANAVQHGIYKDVLTPEEQALWDTVRLGDVDDELRLCRIRLRRAMVAQAEVQQAPADTGNLAGFELVEIRRSAMSGAPPTVDAVSRRHDYTAIIERLLGRIGQLEKIRSELVAAAGGGEAKTPLPWVD